MCKAKQIESADQTVSGKLENCWKCGGLGRIDVYSGIANGICFACDGSGSLPAGKASTRGDGVHTFIVDGLVWQFEAINHGNLNPGYREERGNGCHLRIDSKATGHHARVDSVIFQVFKNGGKRKSGVTILRARVSPEIGRKVWKDAIAGMKPEAMNDEYLQASGCGRSRNGRGIMPL